MICRICMIYCNSYENNEINNIMKCENPHISYIWEARALKKTFAFARIYEILNSVYVNMYRCQKKFSNLIVIGPLLDIRYWFLFSSSF